MAPHLNFASTIEKSFARHNMRERGGKNTDKENLGELWDIYYNNRSQKSPNV